jgi:hypothetical protein
MKHYAGTVRYNVMNWLEKNKDPLNDTVVQVVFFEILKVFGVWRCIWGSEMCFYKVLGSGGLY